MLRQRQANMENVFDPYNIITLSKTQYTQPVARFDPTLQQNCVNSKVIVSSSAHVTGSLGLWSDNNGFSKDSQITVMSVDRSCVLTTEQVKRLVR